MRLLQGEAGLDGSPAWVVDSVFYQILPDRFRRGSGGWPADRDARSPGREPCGGDLRGILNALPYLEDLGITGIYLTPVFTAASYHRYDTIDYTSVDPALGGNTALRVLIDALHERGMRIVLDGVFNHCGSHHPYFIDARERGDDSPYRNWFKFGHAGAFPPYACWAGVPSLPEWNLSRPEVRGHLLEIVRHWIRAYDIDGWRLDAVDYLPPDFVHEIYHAAKEEKKDAYLLGEVMGLARPWILHNALDGSMHYRLYDLCVGWIAEARFDAARFARELYKLWYSLPGAAHYASLTLLGSHDTPRFLHRASGDVRRLLLAAAFQMTFPGAPSIYYGDEIGLSGGEDPENRGCFPWDEAQWSRSIRSVYKSLVALRKTRPSLRCGGVRVVSVKGNALAVSRRWREEETLILLNAEETTSVSFAELDGKARDLLDNADPANPRLVVPPLDFRVLDSGRA